MLTAVGHLLVIACIAQHQRAVRCVDVALAAVFAHALDAVAVAQPASVGAVGVWCAHVVLQCVDQTKSASGLGKRLVFGYEKTASAGGFLKL